MIWVLFGIVTIAVVALLIQASRWVGATADREVHALAIYEDQLTELDRDAARGVISATERDAAATEIKRRMLRLKPTKQTELSGNSTALLVAAVLVPMGAAVLYFGLGRPDIPAAPYADRVAAGEELDVLTERLRTALLADPNGGETKGWRLLATTLSNQGEFARALEAYRTLLSRPDATSVDFSMGAETAIQDGLPTSLGEAKIWATKSLELSPSNPAGSYYLAYVLSQEGKQNEAFDVLADRVAAETDLTEWMPWFIDFGQQLATATGQDMFDFPTAPGGPSAADIEAAEDMSEEDRSAMIQGMVDGLAARLEEDPADINGWLQLARAYSVLGEVENAIAAFEQVLARTQAGDPRRALAEEGLAALR